MTQLQKIIVYLTRKLGHIPSPEEMRLELNGIGFIQLIEEIQKEEGKLNGKENKF